MEGKRTYGDGCASGRGVAGQGSVVRSWMPHFCGVA
jgi:hypothetical protein